MSGGESLVLAGLLIAVALVAIFKAYECEAMKNRFDDGYECALRIAASIEDTPEEQAVFEATKIAFKHYIKASRLYRKGDCGRIDKAADWQSLKDVIYDVAVCRKSLK